MRPNPRPLAILEANLTIIYIDVGAAMKQHMIDHEIRRFAGSELSIGENDGHLSSLGHRVAARKIVQEIQHLLPSEGDGD